MSRFRQFELRVTRRIVALFVVCALLPATAALVVSYVRMHEILVEQRSEALAATASAYTTALIDRLQLAEDLSRLHAATPASTPAPRAGLGTHFRTAIYYGPGDALPVFGGSHARPDREAVGRFVEGLPAGAPGLMIVPGPGEAGVWLVRRHIRTGDAIALELAPRYLWEVDDTLGYLEEPCVLGPGNVPLHCAPEAATAIIKAQASRPAGGIAWKLAWETGGRRILGGQRDVFLRGMFAADAWTVVVGEPEDQALAPVHALAKIVLPLVLLGILVAALLGLGQVRRTLGPLNELLQATDRVARYDFDARVRVVRRDEFGVLAEAFNAMSARLGRQFKALQANADIDSVVLTNVELPKVAGIALERMAELVRADHHHVLLAESDPASGFRVHSAGALNGLVVALDEAEAARLLCAGKEARPQEPLRALEGIAGRAVYVVPISVSQQLVGALVLGYDGEAAPDDEGWRLLQGLADRVAVAVATARRDRELYSRAHFDALTGLPNRRLGVEELDRAIAAAERERRTVALLFVDLDGFSGVNDSLGHAAGDALLRQAAARLRGCVRRSDLVARLGGDEFAVLLPQIREATDAALVARNIVEAMGRSFELEGTGTFISASVGIALYPDDGPSGELLLRHADLAMYAAKEKGRGEIVFFSAGMNAEVQRRTQLDKDLRSAIQLSEFELHFQPQLDLRTRRIVGAEALIRWNHPVRGLVPPDQFIAFAESSGHIDAIGTWALERAALQLAAWRGAGLELGHVSVNVSPRQLRAPGFVRTVEAALSASGIQPGALRLEITESSMMDRDGATQANIDALLALGTPLELDDFGTGYSSLAHLQRLAVATVKLDLEFIRHIESRPASLAIVRAAIRMVHALGKTVIAEGVETEGQYALLSEMGCDTMQGYYLSAALPAAGFARFVLERQALMTSGASP